MSFISKNDGSGVINFGICCDILKENNRHQENRCRRMLVTMSTTDSWQVSGPKIVKNAKDYKFVMLIEGEIIALVWSILCEKVKLNCEQRK